MKVMKAVLALGAGKQCGGSCKVVDVFTEQCAVDLRRRCGDETVVDDNDELKVTGRGTASATFYYYRKHFSG